ncbi:MAG: tRNA lysidine(34) synthetase TilS, partial [Candidatus Glassbacteria bacterium RBG_16_58_8]
ERRMKGFLERIAMVLEEESLAKRGERILIACSGGVDSMVLLDVMSRLGRTSGFSVYAAHLDHGLRGREGWRDQRTVARFCRSIGVPFLGGSSNVARLSEERRVSIQLAARYARYAFYLESLRQIGGDKIATAHHADDQVETILMRLLRGTGPLGLQGIPMKRDSFYIRPLLGEWKSSIQEYASSIGLPYREDPGNRESRYHRNRIRNCLIPHLEAYNPSLKACLLRLSTWAGEERQTIHYFIDNTLKDIEYVRTGDEVAIRRSKLLVYPPVVWKEIMRAAIQDLGEHYGPDGRCQSRMIDFLRNAPSGKRMDLPSRLVLGRDFDEYFLRKRRVKEVRTDLMVELTIEPEWKGEFRHGNYLWNVSVELLARGKISDPRGRAFHQYFDICELALPLCIRTWRPGDFLEPGGMKGRKKVSDLLIESGIPRRRRDEVLVLSDEKSVIWIIGIRRGRRGWILGSSREVVSVKIDSQEFASV